MAERKSAVKAQEGETVSRARQGKEPASSAAPSEAVAKAPTRSRGHLRVATLLDAAATAFAEKGYAATTMTEIALRAQSSIGSLYQFFPTKEQVAMAVVARQADALFARLDEIEASAPQSDVERLAHTLCGTLIAFRAAHPSFALLIETPGAPPENTLAVRTRMRERLADILRHKAPQRSRAELDAIAAVTQQVMKSAVALNAEPQARKRNAALAQQRTMLARYFSDVLA
ncbi:TetR/AcrR family transcriptional regulator [Niveibacterium sp. SC-1]|uniref:TetR/AcrR family transcriptional regulator n=1 Tax=Niveibacterium sp. SC-1 TaxID=3135646 RepID=UPI00311EFADB